LNNDQAAIAQSSGGALDRPDVDLAVGRQAGHRRPRMRLRPVGALGEAGQHQPRRRG
jgi:hypothetical protein